MKIKGLIATTLTMAILFSTTGCNQNNLTDKENPSSSNSSTTSDTAHSDTSVTKTMLTGDGEVYKLYNASHYIQQKSDSIAIYFSGYEADDYDSTMTTMCVEITGELCDKIYQKAHHDQKPDANFMLTIANFTQGTFFTESNAENNDYYECSLLVEEADDNENAKITVKATMLENGEQSYILEFSGTFSLEGIGLKET